MRSRPLRRLLAVLACLIAVLLPEPASSARPATTPTVGDRIAGPPAWRVAAPSATNGVRWTDVNKKHWARAAVDYVGATNDWMRDFPEVEPGLYPFQPDTIETRELFVRAMVRAFGAELVADPKLTFEDLPKDDPFFTAANIAVSQGWLDAPDGSFLPDEAVTTADVHRAIVFALGLADLAKAADALHLRDGTAVPTPPGFGTMLIGMRLGLRYNHDDESLDVGPGSELNRAEVAWSLYRAATAPEWVRDSLAAYATIELPNLSPHLQRVVAWGVRYVGYPYLWGGEWAEPTPPDYCCGWQPRGGFDCSGLTWWLMKKADAGWDNTPPRDYNGWALPERGSAQMASVGNLKWDEIKAGDLLFYDGDGDGTVDHVDTYIGNGWALDSGSSNAGVTITRVEGTWYQEHFVHARRVRPPSKAQPPD
jgi:cell wall-associated NlpC family hydrolase